MPSWLQGKHYGNRKQSSDSPGRDLSVVACDPQTLDHKQRDRLRFIVRLLKNTQKRKPYFGCFGLHEWAMVYRGKDVRHGTTTPLRLPQEKIDLGLLNPVRSPALTLTRFVFLQNLPSR